MLINEPLKLMNIDDGYFWKANFPQYMKMMVMGDNVMGICSKSTVNKFIIIFVVGNQV